MLIIFNTIFKCLLRKHHVPLLEKHFWVPKVSTKLNNDNDNDNNDTDNENDNDDNDNGNKNLIVIIIIIIIIRFDSIIVLYIKCKNLFLLSCQIKLRLGSSPLARQMQGLLIWGNISKLESQLRQISEKDLYFDGRNCCYWVLHVVFNTLETWLISLQIQETTRGWAFQSKVNIFYKKDWLKLICIFQRGTCRVEMQTKNPYRRIRAIWNCVQNCNTKAKKLTFFPSTFIGVLERFLRAIWRTARSWNKKYTSYCKQRFNFIRLPYVNLSTTVQHDKLLSNYLSILSFYTQCKMYFLNKPQ